MDLGNVQPGPEGAQASNPEAEDHEVEDEAQRKLSHLVSVFPNMDPEFLHAKVLKFAYTGQQAVYLTEYAISQG